MQANAVKPSEPAKEPPKVVVFRMRCGRIVRMLDTPLAREKAKRMGWTEAAS